MLTAEKTRLDNEKKTKKNYKFLSINKEIEGLRKEITDKALLQHWLHKGVERLGRRHNTQPNDNTPQNEVICYSEKRHPEPEPLSVNTLYSIFIAILRVAMRVYIC